MRDSIHIATIRVRASHYRMWLERPQQPLFIASLQKIGKKWEAKCFDNHRLEGWTLRGVERMVRDYWDKNLTEKNDEDEKGNHH